MISWRWYSKHSWNDIDDRSCRDDRGWHSRGLPWRSALILSWWSLRDRNHRKLNALLFFRNFSTSLAILSDYESSLRRSFSSLTRLWRPSLWVLHFTLSEYLWRMQSSCISYFKKYSQYLQNRLSCRVGRSGEAWFPKNLKIVFRSFFTKVKTILDSFINMYPPSSPWKITRGTLFCFPSWDFGRVQVSLFFSSYQVISVSAGKASRDFFFSLVRSWATIVVCLVL